MAAAGLQGTHGLEHALLQGAAYRHHLSGGLHLGSELIGSLAELVERETRHLGDYIVDGRFAAGRSSGYGDLVKGKAHGDLGRHTCNRETACLGCKGRRTGHAGIDLDDVILE